MSGTEIGPNDIIIHLVNPYKCMDCGTEFFHRTSFLQHLSEHMDKLKTQHPCFQIVCGVNLAAQQPNSVTVTKDILQINENQIFELQDSSIDYTQLPPLKMLEQAGILRLPTQVKAGPVSLLNFQTNTPALNVSIPSTRSLLQPRMPQRNKTLIQEQESTATTLSSSLGFLTDHVPEDKQLAEATIDLNSIQDLQPPGTANDEELQLQALVQQALLDNESLSKEDLSAAQTFSFPDNNSHNMLRKNDNNSGPFTVISTIDIAKGPDTWVSVETTQKSQHHLHPQQPQQQHPHQQSLPGVKHVVLFKEMPEPLPPQVDGDRRQVECKICLNRFASKNVLMRHQVVHSGEKPHTCLKCFKQFNDISSLSKHIKIHKRSHQCPVCLKMFLRRRQMELHLGQHKKKRFIQFGHKYHEVQIATSRNESGQIVHEFSLSVLLAKRSNEDDAQKENEVLSENSGQSQIVEVPINATSSAESVDINASARDTLLLHPSGGQLSEGNMRTSHNINSLDDMPRIGNKHTENLGTCKVVYRCGHCKKLINTRSTLSRHLMLHTNERPFRCEQCGKKFRHKSDLVHHYKTHSKPVKCATCGSAFSKDSQLHNHLLKGCPFLELDNEKFVVLPDLRYQCNLCSKVLKSRANMVRHLRVHTFNSKESDSKKVWKNIHKLSDQGDEGGGNLMEIVSDNPEDYMKALDESVGFRCLLCGEEFRYRSYLVIHVRMHLGLRPFKCKDCGKGFHGRHMLRKHQQNHTRPFKCPQCGKGFNRHYLMSRHFQKDHNDEAEDRMKDMTYLQEGKVLQCDICGKTMKSYQRSLMQYHIRLHKDVRPHQCKVCDKTYASAIALKKHSANHSKPYVCQVCNKGYSRRYLMLDHFEQHCKHRLKKQKKESEEKTTDNDNSLQDPRHNKIIILKTEEENGGEFPKSSQVKPYQADITTEIDETKGVEVFKCVPCDKTFTAREALTRHMRTFKKSTPCKYCKKFFEDKHLTLAHQRSCLGSVVTAKIETLNSKISNTKLKVVSEKQEKVLRTMKAMKSVIEDITVEPVLAETKSAPQTQLDGNQSADQDLEEVLSLLNSEHDGNENEANSDPVLTVEAPVADSDTTNRQNSAIAGSRELVTNKQVSSEPKGDSKSSSYHCPNCTKTFVTPRGLKIHAASHVRLYKCEECDQDFTQVARFRHHVKSHHSNNNTSADEGKVKEETGKMVVDDDANERNTYNVVVRTNVRNESGNAGSERSTDLVTNLLVNTDNNAPTTALIKLNTDDETVDISGSGKQSVSSKPMMMKENENKNKASVDIEQEVRVRLMQSGTRGRPFSCNLCRKRFTEKSVLNQHLGQVHGVTS